MLNFILEVFDLFSFKNKFTETRNVENFLLIKSIIKEEIINQSIKNIDGSQKMENVVNCVNSFIDKHVTTDNKIVQWIINIIKKCKPNVNSIYLNLNLLISFYCHLL